MINTKDVKKFDWNQFVVIPEVTDEWLTGRQVLNFFPCDKDYRDAPASKSVVEKYFCDAKVFDTDAALMKFASDHTKLDGFYLEMGVCTGRTINFIAALNSDKLIYGFDSFEGLPQAWERSDIPIPIGTFAMKNSSMLPPVLHNVRLVKGLFKETLSRFKTTIMKDAPIAFLHVDCDIYASTKDIFDLLGDRIVPGTVIVFDELYNYSGFEQHEWKALQEFLETSEKKACYIGYNQYWEQVAIRIE